jgi:ComF family protein
MNAVNFNSNSLVNIWKQYGQFYRRCLFCGDTAEREMCCAACYRELPWNDPACIRCGLPLTVSAGVCGRCLHAPPPFDAAVCAFAYQFPINRLLVKLKFGARLGHARALGLLLAERVERDPRNDSPEALIPVPLHANRLRQRGFNQAAEIARAAGARLKLPVLTNICERGRDTAAQYSLTAAARQRNVRGSFSIRRPLPIKRLAIVDDVVTTGATVGELARTFRASGAINIQVWSAARA